MPVISTYITDGDVLSHIMETATNQVELVRVIEEGWDKIYLCQGPFSVPIHIKGKHYIGLGDPVINTPFTQEQYKRAGVTSEGVKLPEEPDQSILAVAEEAAEANGYTDWEDERGEFVELLHRGMECKRYDFAPALDVDDMLIEFRTYHSREKAAEDARELVNRTYDQAIRMMTPGTEDCVAGPLAAYYGAVLRAKPMVLARKLRSLDKRADRLCVMLQEGETRLREELEERLFKGSDYYHMYRRQYFLDRIRVTRLDSPAEVFESDFLNNILHFFAEDPDYTVGGVSENMVTLKNDFDSRMSTLCECAYERYVSYCKEIEKITGEIEADLADDGWKNDIQG